MRIKITKRENAHLRNALARYMRSIRDEIERLEGHRAFKPVQASGWNSLRECSALFRKLNATVIKVPGE